MSDTVEPAQTPKRCPSCDTQLRADARFCGNCGTKLPQIGELDASSLVGSLVAGAYRIDGILGTGSMGVVYRAEQVALKRPVALKVIGESSDDNTTRARFRREARAASQLNHPNVVQVYDFGELPGGQPYLAMELLQGQTLEQLIDREFPLEPERVIAVMVDVLSALQAAHTLGILHRDLKPANVFISVLPDGREVAKVLDFGIATAMDGTLTGSKTWAPLTEAGFVCGTPAFMSPEQVQGFPLDQRSDLFSAAGLMYQMLTKERPFRGKSPVEVGANIVLKPLIPPTKARPDLVIPSTLDRVLSRAMAKKPEDRYASAAEMVEVLQELATRLEDPDWKEDEDEGEVEPVVSKGPVAPTAEWVELSSDDFETADTVVDRRFSDADSGELPSAASDVAPDAQTDEALRDTAEIAEQAPEPVSLPSFDLFADEPWPDLADLAGPTATGAPDEAAEEVVEPEPAEDEAVDDSAPLAALVPGSDVAPREKPSARTPIYTPVALQAVHSRPRRKSERSWPLWLLLTLGLALGVAAVIYLWSR